MKTRVQLLHGNLIIAIPPKVASRAQVSEGSVVDLTVERGRIVASPSGTRISVLNELLAQVTDHNRHGETAWDVRSP